MVRHAGEVASCVQAGSSAITATHAITLRGGARLFGKTLQRGASPRLLAEESASLEAIAQTKTVRVPAIVARGERWMLLEWLDDTRAARVIADRSSKDKKAWRALGSGIARLHTTRNATYGWPRDNFIGSLEQVNTGQEEWSVFWRDQRIIPLARSAHERNLLNSADMKRVDRMCAELDETLAPSIADGASLLHGDLWSGNIMLLDGDDAAVFDPSCYYGHRETDLAMAALFGGFNAEFFDAYEGLNPLQPEWRRRRSIYQLYYLLAHVVMFGGSYRGMTLDALGAAGY